MTGLFQANLALRTKWWFAIGPSTEFAGNSVNALAAELPIASFGESAGIAIHMPT